MTSVGHLPATIRLGDLEICRLGFGTMQLPGPGVWGPPSDPARARAVLRRAVELGMTLIDTSWYYGPLVANQLIRHIGLSNVTLPQLRHALARTPLVSLENLYNVAAGPRRLAHLPQAVVEDQDDVLALCEARGLAFLPFYSLAIPYAGVLEAPAVAAIAARRGVTQAQVAIAWQLARSPAMLPIPGTGSLAHLEENWAARTIALDAEELAAIRRARA